MSFGDNPGDYNDEDFDALAGWDGGKPTHSRVRDDGHASVGGQIDGKHYHVSWDKGGENLHSTFDKGDNQFTIDHD